MSNKGRITHMEDRVTRTNKPYQVINIEDSLGSKKFQNWSDSGVSTDNIAVGDWVSYTYTTNNGFHSITGITKLDKTEIKEVEAKVVQASDAKERRITRATAVNAAVAFLGDKPERTPDNILQIANTLFDYIWEGVGDIGDIKCVGGKGCNDTPTQSKPSTKPKPQREPVKVEAVAEISDEDDDEIPF